MFPLIAATGSKLENKEWLPMLCIDAALLHITAFSTEAFIQMVLLRKHDQINDVAALHFQRAVRLLRDRISGQDDDDKLSDSTLSVVSKLVSTAHFMGDSCAAQQHMQGLRRMVDLRGGLDIFKGTHMLVQMVR
jgi:hypothetical protein